MAIYRLWRQSDDHTFEVIDAADKKHALAQFEEKHGLALTLEEGDAAPEYMMGRMEKNVCWTHPPDIPVWEKA